MRRPWRQKQEAEASGLGGEEAVEASGSSGQVQVPRRVSSSSGRVQVPRRVSGSGGWRFLSGAEIFTAGRGRQALPGRI